MKYLVRILAPTLIFLLFLQAMPAIGQEKKEKEPWKGKLADGTVITEKDLVKILVKHLRWVVTDGKKGKQANLSRAWLTGVVLGKAILNIDEVSKAEMELLQQEYTDLVEITLERHAPPYPRRATTPVEKVKKSAVDLKRSVIRVSLDLKMGRLIDEFKKGVATLERADLTGANLREAKLTGANLREANLFLANLREANLTQADLSEANLLWARLDEANLTLADLSEANLTDANLREANLTGANLREANLLFVNFEPKLGTLPDISKIATAVNLFSLRFVESPHVLTELREAFKKAGFREQERELTYAIKHTQRLKLWNDKDSDIWDMLESLFNLFMFEGTCQYGMTPGRPLLILGVLIPVFSILYMIALRVHGQRTGIWAVLLRDRVLKGVGKEKPIKLTSRVFFRPLHERGFARIRERSYRWLRVVRIGLYFSLLSAFRIGWRELNVGNWITRLQRREYTLQATGWVRTVSGIQSLLSVYLLALWVLTYFGRPFE